MPKKNYMVVRTHSAGVFAGVVRSRKGTECVIDECRRLWYWDGAASLSQLAVEGVSKPQNCKFSVETNGHIVTEAIEYIPMTSKAVRIIKGVPAWKA